MTTKPRSPAADVDRSRLLAAVETERLRLADFLDELEPPAWEATSLCPERTMREVLAHLTTATRSQEVRTVVGAIRAQGDIDRVIADQGRERAAEFDPATLIAQLRDTAGSSRRMLGSSRWDQYVDIVVHSQDIARPLGREYPVPTELLIPALRFVWASRFYGAGARYGGVRFVAEDIDWTLGDGPTEVRGSGADLLMLGVGRSAVLEGLVGSGVDGVASR